MSCGKEIDMTHAQSKAATVSWTGRYFEDFAVGDVYRHPLGRTVTATDNSWLTLLSQNTAPLHFDRNYAAQTAFGKPLVDSTFTLALVTGQSVTDVSQHVMADLGWDRVRMPNPLFEGETVYSQSEVLAVRPSVSRPDVGIVTVRTLGFTETGKIVITFERTVMVYRRGHGPQFAGVEPIWDERASKAAGLDLLFVPGDRQERFGNALDSGADAVIVDLEDAVAPEHKEMARQHVVALLAERSAYVRINSADTECYADDLASLAGARNLAGMVLPKSTTAEQIDAVAGVLMGIFLDDSEPSFERWLTERLEGLTPGIRAEAERWTRTLRDGGPRSLPRRPDTVWLYLNRVRPALLEWSDRYDHLREVTHDDVLTYLKALHGRHRHDQLVALRSLFTWAKRNGLIFRNPTTRIKVGGRDRRSERGGTAERGCDRGRGTHQQAGVREHRLQPRHQQ
jgi:itaconyl-CoA hydratase